MTANDVINYTFRNYLQFLTSFFIYSLLVCICLVWLRVSIFNKEFYDDDHDDDNDISCQNSCTMLSFVQLTTHCYISFSYEKNINLARR